MNAPGQSRIQLGEWATTTPEETFQLGADIGARLAGGEILLLNGTLGAGKTVFVKGVMYALDFDSHEVTSPTFTLVNLYKASLTVYHLDLYRLNEGFKAADAVDLDELIADERAVIIVEWAERLAGYPLPASNVYRVSFVGGEDDDTRHITITRNDE